MNSNINRSALVRIYRSNESTVGKILSHHKKKLEELALKDEEGNVFKTHCYTSEQLKYIVTVAMGGEPDGYFFDGKTLKKQEENIIEKK